MNPTSRRRLASTLLLAGLLGSCAGAPIQEMSDARQAVRAARDAGAAVQARGLLEQAERGMTSAEDALQGDRFFEARSEAVQAKEAAVGARRLALAITRAEAAVDEAQRLGVRAGEASALLAWARAAAGGQGGGDDALDLAEQAERQAEADVNQHYLAAARRLIQDAGGRRPTLSPDDLVRLDAASAAAEREEGRQAYDLARGLPGAGGRSVRGH
jgi:hypothetical protein